MNENQEKQCGLCSEAGIGPKPLLDFYWLARRGYYSNWCKACTIVRSKEGTANRKRIDRGGHAAGVARRREARIRKRKIKEEEAQAKRDYWRKRKETAAARYSAARKLKALKRCYGMTFDQKVLVLELQDSKCMICGQGLKVTRAISSTAQKVAVVDHNHTTGKVRDLLCSQCNTGIGMLAEDPERMRAAAAYIERHALCY